MTTISYEDFLALCTKRRSIRYYKDEPISEKDVRDILSTGHLAPSVQNMQPWRFHVIRNPELKKELMTTSCYGNFTAGAAVFIVVGCDQSMVSPDAPTLWNPRELEYSCMSAMEHILLAATSKGLASCWVSMHHGKAHEILKLPIRETVVGGLMLGHMLPANEGDPSEHKRKELEEVMMFHD